MLIDTACPHCHHPCSWSNTSETKYVRCAFCERTFAVSTFGMSQPVTRRRPRRRQWPLWPWFVVAGLTCLIVVVVSLLLNSQRQKASETKVTVENFQRLQLGMAERDILQILGLPTRTDRSLVPQVDAHMIHRFEVSEEEFTQRCFWEDGDNVIWIDLRKGRVENFGATLEGEQFGQKVEQTLQNERANTDVD
jgi:hypothetical protein